MIGPGGQRTSRSRRSRLGLLVFLLWVVSAVPGCGGCGSSTTPPKIGAKPRSEETEEDILNKKKPEKPKPPFEPAVLTMFPADTASDSPESPMQVVKPGHWQTLSVQTKANLGDFVGTAELQVNDSQMQPLPLLDTQFYLRTQRGVSLPKGQDKQLEALAFIPEGRTGSSTSLKLEAGGGGITFPFTTGHLPAFTYHLVVLTPARNEYGYLKQLDSIACHNEQVTDEDVKFYRVSIPSVKAKLPLPTDPFCWTSIAYILWDDLDPTLLKSDQQEALIDWLHWGGNLIVSGPGSLALLKGSFLEPYLPVTDGPARELTTADLRPLSDTFALRDDKGTTEQLQPTGNWVGVQMELVGADALHSPNQFVPETGNLVASGRVGRGRVTVTAFRLRQRELINWRSFDSFFNGCLLRREPRTFKPGLFQDAYTIWANYPDRILDPTFNTHLRLLSRDSGRMEIQKLIAIRELEDDQNTDLVATKQSFNIAGNNQALTETFKNLGGVGAWNDKSDISEAARSVLREAAGITIPSASFVLKMLGWYLLLIAPANYSLFRALGRVEWAWAAVPVMALAAAGIVIWAAQLDIGFSRSRTEIAVVEVFGQHPRAHVTRYQALYSSLATDYGVSLSSGAHALPMARVSKSARSETIREVDFRYDTPAELTGFEVSSNTTDMIHSEQLLESKGAFHLSYPSEAETGEWSVYNQTEVSLHDVLLLHAALARESEVHVAYYHAKELPAGEKVTFTKFDERPEELDAAQESSRFQPARAGSLSSLPLRAAVCKETELEPGEIRLVGEFTADLPDVTVKPSAKQNKQLGLLVAHLHYEVGGTPTKDVCLRPKPRAITWEEQEQNSLLGP